MFYVLYRDELTHKDDCRRNNSSVLKNHSLIFIILM